MDYRLQIFTLWTDPAYDNIIEELKVVSIDRVNIARKVMQTNYRCWHCKKLKNVDSEVIHIARNPKKFLFEGEHLVCETCMEKVVRGTDVNILRYKYNWHGAVIGMTIRKGKTTDKCLYNDK